MNPLYSLKTLLTVEYFTRKPNIPLTYTKKKKKKICTPKLSTFHHLLFNNKITLILEILRKLPCIRILLSILVKTKIY